MSGRFGRRHAAAVIALGLGVATAACGSSSSSSAGSTTGGAGAAATVTAQNIAFTPATVAVSGSTQVTITFVNADNVEHSLTFDDNSQSVDADGGQSKALTFTAPAAGTTITFHCKYHASMHGTITVGGGQGAATVKGSSSTSSSSGYGF